MGSCKNDDGSFPGAWNCPDTQVEPRPRSLNWHDRFVDTPPELASPYRGQLFDDREAAAIEFIAYLVDRHLLSEWPESERQALSAGQFDHWYAGYQERGQPPVPRKVNATQAAPV